MSISSERSPPDFRPPLPALACVQATLCPDVTSVSASTPSARARVGALAHVVDAISNFLYPPMRWSLARACERNLQSLVPRITATRERLQLGEDPVVWACEGSRALAAAVRHGDFATVEWLHAHCAQLLPFSAMIEAARLGDLCTLQWLADRHERAPWLPSMMEAAAATGQLETLKWMHAHPKNPGCSRLALEGAIRGGHMDTLRWLLSTGIDCSAIPLGPIYCALWNGYYEVIMLLLTVSDPCRFEALVMEPAYTIPASKGDLEMVQWMYANCPKGGRRINVMDEAARGGHFHIVQWLHEHHPDSCTERAMDNAALGGHLEMLQWLHAHRSEGCSSEAMRNAARNGHMHIVKWLYKNRMDGSGPWAMDGAAEHGHLEVLKFFHKIRIERCSINALDEAAVNGHLEVVQWLSTNRTEGCTKRAMDGAAGNGHLEVVKWLHEHRAEGCTIRAMNDAASNGHLEVVKWLHANRSEGCSKRAMDEAALNGHLEVVKWLHQNRFEGSTADTVINNAARNGHFAVVRWLCENLIEGFSVITLRTAALNGNFEIALFVLEKCRRSIFTPQFARSAEFLQTLDIAKVLQIKVPYMLDVPSLRANCAAIPGLVDYVLG